MHDITDSKRTLDLVQTCPTYRYRHVAKICKIDVKISRRTRTSKIKPPIRSSFGLMRNSPYNPTPYHKGDMVEADAIISRLAVPSPIYKIYGDRQIHGDQSRLDTLCKIIPNHPTVLRDLIKQDPRNLPRILATRLIMDCKFISATDGVISVKTIRRLARDNPSIIADFLVEDYSSQTIETCLAHLRNPHFRLRNTLVNTIRNDDAARFAYIKTRAVELAKKVHNFHTEEYDFERYLSNTSYSESRKEQLRKCLQKNFQTLTHTTYRNNSFIKLESYPDYKPARSINSRADQFKVLTATFFDRIGRDFFHMEEAIKHIPENTRAQVVIDKARPYQHYMSTDFSRFETSFSPQILESCEFVLYDLYNSDQFRHLSDFNDYIKTSLLHNRCLFENYQVKTEGVRMSGDMCTSLGNSFTNLLLSQTFLDLSNCDGTQFVEGDDCLYMYNGDPNMLSWVSTTVSYSLGFNLKEVIQSDDLSDMTFLSSYYNAQYPYTLRDPIRSCVRSLWTFHRLDTQKFLDSLLLARAIGNKVSQPGVPMINALSNYMIRQVPKDTVPRLFNTYFREQYEWMFKDYKLYSKEPDAISYAIVEQNFKIPISIQILFERCCDDDDLVSAFHLLTLLYPRIKTDANISPLIVDLH